MYLQLKSSAPLLRQHGNNMRQAGQCRHLRHDQSDVLGFGMCQVASTCS